MSSRTPLAPHKHRLRRLGKISLTAAMIVGLVTALPATSAVAATTNIVQDDFGRTVSTGLASAPVGGAYTSYAAGAAGLSVSGGAAKMTNLQPGQAVGSVLNSASARDTALSSSLVLPARKDLYYALEARRQSDGSAYRGKVKVTGTGALSLSFSRTAGSSETLLGRTDLPFVVQDGQKLRLQIEVTGTSPVQLRIRAWLDGSAQPGWQYELQDNSGSRIQAAGSVGFWAYVSSTASSAVSFQIPELSADSLTTVAPVQPAPSDTVSAVTGKPTAGNTGVPAGTSLTRYNGPLTITADNTVIDKMAVYGDLKIQAKNVIIRNSYLHCGTNTPSGNSGCVDANSASVYNLQVLNNTINPDKPSYYRDGIVGHEFTARGNNITRTNDGIGIFNKPGGSVNANVTVESNYIHDLTHWNYDPAHSDGTHNDGIEVQGGQNISIKKNNVVGSAVAGDGLGTYGTHAGAALIVVQNVSPFANLVIDGNWFDDGQNSVCIQNAKWSTVKLTLSNNRFGHNQYDFGGGSKYAIRIYSRAASTISGLNTNRWDDNNVLMTEGKSNGIRYNA